MHISDSQACRSTQRNIIRIVTFLLHHVKLGWVQSQKLGVKLHPCFASLLLHFCSNIEPPLITATDSDGHAMVSDGHSKDGLKKWRPHQWWSQTNVRVCVCVCIVWHYSAALPMFVAVLVCGPDCCGRPCGRHWRDMVRGHLFVAVIVYVLVAWSSQCALIISSFEVSWAELNWVARMAEQSTEHFASCSWSSIIVMLIGLASVAYTFFSQKKRHPFYICNN